MQRGWIDRAMTGFGAAWLALAACSVGCAPTLETPNDSSDAGPQAPAEPMINQDQDDGTTITQVNATSDVDFLFIDLEDRVVAAVAVPEDSEGWDLAFRRFNIKVNGGVSGTGGMEIAGIFDTDFGEVTAAPADGWVTDQPDAPAEEGGDDNSEADYAFVTGDTRWFSYSPANHVLTPKDIVYAVRTVDQNFFKLQLLSYYDDAGTPAMIRFQWAPIDPP